MKVLSVFGTRPEAVKMAPLINLIRKTDGLESVVCVTAQHRQMLDQVLSKFSIKPEYDLNLMKPGQTLAMITSSVLQKITDVIQAEKPGIVLVHGDPTTSMAAAMAAFYAKILIGHVEAGLRSFDRYSPFPEEMNRSITSRLATLHFAPTEANRENLAREGIREHVYVVGNTVIDAIYQMTHNGFVFKDPNLRSLNLKEGRWILVTAHRRENLGKPLESICRAVRRVTDQYPDVRIIFPMHLNPAVRETVNRILSGHERIHLIDPVEVEDMYALIKAVRLVMTDSGGIQEEAPSLGTPVIILRTKTERPEGVRAGKAVLAGVREEAVFAEANRLLRDNEAYERMSGAVNLYGDGKTSERIVSILLRFIQEKSGE